LEETVKKYRGRLKAIVPDHLYGHLAHMTDIMHLSARYNLRVLEDCAQAHGAIWEDRKTGTFGDIAAFSFYPTKNLGATRRWRSGRYRRPRIG